MIGNDVVDLLDRDTDPDTLNPRFDSRVFAARELRELAVHPDPRRQRWRLWAAKEAAYKALRQLDAATPFSPARFLVSLEPDGATGEARRGAQRLSLRIREEQSAIHAVAGLVGASGLAGIAEPPGAAREGAAVRWICGLKRLDEADDPGSDPELLSRRVRELARASLASELRLPPEQISFSRERRIPRLWLGHKPARASLSFSHHGSAVAFACAIAPAQDSAHSSSSSWPAPRVPGAGDPPVVPPARSIRHLPDNSATRRSSGAHS